MARFILPDDDVLPSKALVAACFERPAPLVARELLGKLLVSTVGGVTTGGAIVEAEAYLGPDDPGSHAATRKITDRNRVMYDEPGTVYVYFTYGNHHMLNLVCESSGTASAVLIRALEPLVGVEQMIRRRSHGGTPRPPRELCNGPGKLAQALGVDLTDNGSRLGEGRIVVYDSPRVPAEDVAVSGRVGLSAGHELQLRFYLNENRFVSRGKTGPAPGRGTQSRKDDR